MTKTIASRTRGRTIPGPRGNLVLGSIRDIQRDNIQTFMDAHREYGDIVHFRGPLTINLVVHPDYVEHVLRHNYKNYPRPDFVADKLKTIVGDGLVGAEGDQWASSRKKAQPAFHPKIVESYASAFVETTNELLDSWSVHADRGNSIDVKSEMMHMSLTNLGKTLFKADWSKQVDIVEPIVAGSLSYTNKRLTSPVDPLRFPLPSTKRFQAGLGVLDKIIYDAINDRRAATDTDATDLVSILLNVRDEETGAAMTDKEIRDEISGFFVAGHETVSSALTWTWYLLSKHPDVWRRVRAEANEVIGDRTPTAADAKALQYINRVLLEAMRLYPPIFVLMRCATEEDEIDGFHVPAGANMVLCPYVTHRHTDFWTNPEAFDPDRFLPERAAGLHRMAFFPFSGGPRKCIGNTFAMLQMPLVVAMVAQRFNLALEPGHEPVMEPAISLRPRDALPMYPQRVSA